MTVGQLSTPVALRLLAARVRLSADRLSAMMTTAPGTLGLRPAEGVRRYCLVKVTASPAEGDKLYCKCSLIQCAATGRKFRRCRNKLTNVIPWAFIKRCGLDFLKQGVRSAMAAEQEPCFGSVAVHHHSHLKQVRTSQDVGRAQVNMCTSTSSEEYL